ncbi:hypothetical protein [Acidisoma sp. S159]|jgi:hypothetical protein|uniref:hypothetical protein n=1 Tax=Acidisoma sp. S159 TaxID=1747225 RepID=UPI0015761230|nr:hypothetical protein [Acidisoma sp. S159]
MKLVVVKPFAGLARGDVITDKDRIDAILKGENALHVVRVTTQGGAAGGGK